MGVRSPHHVVAATFHGYQCFALCLVSGFGRWKRRRQHHSSRCSTLGIQFRDERYGRTASHVRSLSSLGETGQLGSPKQLRSLHLACSCSLIGLNCSRTFRPTARGCRRRSFCSSSISLCLYRCLRRQCAPRPRPLLGQRSAVQRHPLQRRTQSFSGQLINRNKASSPPCPYLRLFAHSPTTFHCREMPSKSADHIG